MSDSESVRIGATCERLEAFDDLLDRRDDGGVVPAPRRPGRVGDVRRPRGRHRLVAALGFDVAAAMGSRLDAIVAVQLDRRCPGGESVLAVPAMPTATSPSIQTTQASYTKLASG
jgi:hypothetical protein